MLTYSCVSFLAILSLLRLCFTQVPFKTTVTKKSSQNVKKSHFATTVGIIVYIAIQIFLPFSHNFTPVNTANISVGSPKLG